MGDTDRAYLRRHPWRWLAFFWPHLVIAGALVLNGFAVSGPIFGVVTGHLYWPAGMVAVAALVAASAFWPLHARVQAATAATLGALATFRIIAYVQLLVTPGAIPPQYHAIVWSFIAHWIIALVAAALWPRVSELSALRATVVAGRARAAEVRGAGGVA